MSQPSHDRTDPPSDPPPPRRRGWRRAAWALSVIVLLVGLALGTLFAAVHTERGTRVAWQLATHLLGGKLSGTLDGGTLETGVRLRDVAWRDAGTEISVDHIVGRWRLTRAPWRFTLDALRAGRVDARFAPSTSAASKPSLPARLTLPLQLDIREVRIDRFVLHEGPKATEFTDIALHGSSDGRHHRLVVDSFSSPWGSFAGALALDGVRPFAVSGAVGFSGAVQSQAVQVSARVSGSLELLIADLDATGLKLAGRARVEATPFAAVPLRRVTLAAEHVNPQSIDPAAPAADLTVRAELRPQIPRGAAQAPSSGVRGTGVGTGVAGAGSAASTTEVPRQAAASVSGGSGPLAVMGSISIVNAMPGALDAHRLPLIDAQARVRLDAAAQTIDGLTVRLVDHATITGGGTLHDGRGTLALQVARLNLNALVAALRPTQLAGPVTVTLSGAGQHVAVALADPTRRMRLSGGIDANPARTVFQNVKLSVGEGAAQLNGTLQRDARGSYALKAVLDSFDPLSVLAPPSAKGKTAKAGTHARNSPPAPVSGAIQARVTGAFDVSGTLAPQLAGRAVFALGDSIYDGLPMTGKGTLRFAGARMLPSDANLSIAGNDVVLSGSFGAPGDRLVFDVNAPRLDRLGFGLSGALQTNGDVTGSLAHPDVTASYSANSLAFGENRVGFAQGRVVLRDGASGAMVFAIDARDVAAPGVDLRLLSAHLDGTRAQHTLNASASGTVRGRPIDLTVAASGGLTQTREGMAWDGTISQLDNRGAPQLSLAAPVTVSVAPDRVKLGPTRLTLEGASLRMTSALYDHGRVQSTGTVEGIDVKRMLNLAQELGLGRPALSTDLVLDGNWDFSLGVGGRGFLQIARRSGDIAVNAGHGPAKLGVDQLVARADFTADNRIDLTLAAKAARLGSLTADLQVPVVVRNARLALADDAPLSGHLVAALPSLRTTGGLLGPQYIVDGALASQLTVAGTVAQPKVSGTITGDDISATLLDDGVQFKQGIVRISIADNRVDLNQVEFHGGAGTLRATGQIQLDRTDPNLAAQIVADKFELFATPDRQLSLSGSARLVKGGPLGGVAIDGDFTVDRARFDMPDSPAPKLGSDVVIVQPGGVALPADPPPGVPGAEKPVSPFAPSAHIKIDLGDDFRFSGEGADLGLSGSLVVTSTPDKPLSALGDVHVNPNSTYETFGRKLAIENGFFTFNGPIDNPGINILAMRRNQEVEAGVHVTGTLSAPKSTLVSEPSVPDNDKLSWLLFGHGTETGTNLGQQSTLNTALGLLGQASGKQLAQTIGLDELTIGQSDSGLLDPPVVSIAKALSERFILGYEQALEQTQSLFKATWQISRNWSVVVHTGRVSTGDSNGVDLLFNRRFD